MEMEMESPQNNGRKLLFGCSALGLFLLLCVGGVGMFALIWGAQVASLLGFGPQLEAAKMLPVDTPLYVTVSVNLQNQAGYENLKKLYIDNPDIRQLFDEAQEELSEGAIDFETDILPWVDNEIAFAVPTMSTLAFDAEGENPGFQLLIASRDAEASEAFLEKSFTSQAEQRGSAFEKKEHNGVSYWYLPAAGEAEEDSVAALFNGFVIMTNSEALLANTIDQSDADSSLADNESFKNMMEILPSNRVMFGIFNASSLIAESSEVSGFDDEIPTELLEQAEALDVIGMALTLQSDGIQIDTAQQYDPQKLSESTRNMLNQPANPNEVLNRIPAETLFFANGNNLNQIWQQMREQLAVLPDFEQTLSSMEQETGINLDEDIFNWMTGEFALVLREVSPSEPIPVEGYLLIGTDDTDAAQSGIDQLESLLTNDIGIPITPETISGTDVSVINNPSTNESVAAFGFLSDLFVLGIPAASITTVVEAPNQAITSDPHFNAISNRLPNENTGYFYVNLEGVRELGESNLSGTEREEYDTNVQPFLEPIRAIGATSQMGLQNNSVQSTRLFFLLTE